MPTNSLALMEASGSITATGRSAKFWPIPGAFTLQLGGFGVGTVKLERSYDGGSTWTVMDTFTADQIPTLVAELEPGICYTLNCTAYTSGTITWRASQ